MIAKGARYYYFRVLIHTAPGAIFTGSTMVIDQIRVLVVNNDPQEGELLEDYFHSDHGSTFQITLVKTLSECTRKLEGQPAFDVILLDPELPDCRDGEAFEIIEGYSRGAPVILMAGTPDELLDHSPSSSSSHKEQRFMNSCLLSWAIQYALVRKRLKKSFPDGLQK